MYRVAVLAAPLALLLGLAAPLLSGRAELAFRDGASYYEPQYHFLRREWLAGRFPLWNPWENGGIDMSADPSYGLFYPPKLLLLLPARWPVPYHLYLVFHLVLAYGTLLSGLRGAGRTRLTASLAAMSYAAGGHLLSQIHNSVFLVSASWLPLAWFGLQNWIRRRDTRGLAVSAAALAMMVLGGDPQTAVHFLLIAAVLIALGCWQIPAAFSRKSGREFTAVRARGAARLLVLVWLAAGLSAIQIFVGSSASRSSYRFLYQRPRSVWSRLAAGRLDDRTSAGVPRHAIESSATHDRQIYQFSVAPWRWAELVWPNAGGRFAPRYSRWFDTIPGEGRCWSLSLYAGLLPILAAGLSFRLFRGTVRRRQAGWIVVISATAALGHYGLVWLAQEAGTVVGTQFLTSLPPHAGGFYWLLVETVPGYDLFRYPAKWWSFTALGLALLAGTGVDAAIRRPVLLRIPCHCILVASLGLAVIVGISWRPIEAWWNRAATDPFFAPLSTSAARDDLLGAVGHAAIVAMLLLWLLTWKRYRPTALLLLTLLELAWANQWLIITAPTLGPVEARVAAGAAESFRGRVYRSPNRLVLPGGVKQLPTGKRLERLLHWDRATLYGKHFLDLIPHERSRNTYWPAGACHFGGVVGPESSLMPADLWLALRVRKEAALDRLAVHTAIVPRTDSRRTSASEPAIAPLAGFEEKWPTEAMARRVAVRPWRWCQVVPLGDVIPDPSPASRRIDVQAAWIREQLKGAGNVPVDCSAERWCEMVAHVRRLGEPLREHPESRRSARSIRSKSGGPTGRVTWPFDRSDQIEIRLESTVERASLLVLPHRFSASWKAVASSHRGGEPVSLPVVRVHGLCLGVMVPAGTQKVTLRYRPMALSLGAVVSVACWSLWSVLLLAQLYRMRRSKR